MQVFGSYEKARRYFESHSIAQDSDRLHKPSGGPCITISRQTGLGAENICKKLIGFFESRSGDNKNTWAFFDKDLISRIIQDHDLPERFKKYVDIENLPSKMESFVGEILGTHPPRQRLINKTIQTIRRLGEYGNAVIVGRGSNIILQDFPNTIHIRLVAPESYRVQNAMDLYELTKKQAAEFIEQEDKRRKNFIITHFHKDIEDPLLYHVVLNINRLDVNEIAEMIGCSVINRFPKLFGKNIEIIHH